MKNLKTLYRIVFLLALSLLLLSCLSWMLERPSFVLREITLRPRSLTEMDLLLDFEVQNPNRFDLALTSFTYTVYLNDEEIGSGRLEKELLVPALSVTRVRAPVAAKFKDLAGSLKTVITGDGVSYKIEGKADIKTAVGRLHFPFSKDGRINLKI